jgi:hypothetical protein
MRRSLAVLTVCLIAALGTAPAFGSAIVGRNVTRATLSVDRHGRAHVSYRSGRRTRYVVAWGAINARAPSRRRAQVEFRFHYGLGGKGVCLPYDGPPISWLVKACKAPDGSYWALQAWVRLKPNYGGTTGAKELHLSHWRGPLAMLTISQNWAERRYRHLFGRLTYAGRGVYGFRATGQGAPLDSYGRNIYVDTYESRYGKGWHRENSFLTHHRGHTLGDFCYGFFPHFGHPPGQGTKYRATAVGPGVTPDVLWAAGDIGAFDQTVQDQQQAIERAYGDPKCRT